MIQALEKFGKLRRTVNLFALHRFKGVSGTGVKQAVFLRHLLSQGPCSPAELSRATVTDPAAVHRAVKTLLARKMVERRPHPTDQRQWRILLTPRGTRVAREIESAYAEVAAWFVSPLGPAEKDSLVRLLDRLLAVHAPGLEKEGSKP
jgi:DNA-binding MarR family transcriptional regulator